MAKTLDRGLENREIVLDILTEVLEQGAFVHPVSYTHLTLPTILLV